MFAQQLVNGLVVGAVYALIGRHCKMRTGQVGLGSDFRSRVNPWRWWLEEHQAGGRHLPWNC